MDKEVSFDYFYGRESEQFSYYRIPRLLITGTQFKVLSADAKLLYGLMLDRMGLSAKNRWFDEKGRVFIHYTLDEIQEDMNCSHEKAVKLLAELDAQKGIGLIERVKQGQGKPTLIYVKQFTTKTVPKPVEHLPDCDDSRLPNIGSADFGKPEVSYYSNIYPENSYLNQSINQSELPMDVIDREKVKACVKENIGYISFTGPYRQEADELVELMTDVLCSPQTTFRIGGVQFKSQIVKRRISELRQPHIECASFPSG